MSDSEGVAADKSLRNPATMNELTASTSPHAHLAFVNARVDEYAGNAPPIAVDPVALVISECIAVTSVMRKKPQWAHSSVATILGGGNSSQVDNATKRSTPAPRNAAFLATQLIPKNHSSISASSSENHVSVEGDIALANRWGLRGKKGKSIQDNPLMSAFTRLRLELKNCEDIHRFDAPTLLHPFLQIIRSSSTSAHITSLALVSLTKFFSYNIINRDSPRLPVALQLLSAAITHCRFEATDTSADETVLLRILRLMEDVLSRPEGELLGDESVCEMMETGLSMCCQLRLSEILRRSAEMAMANMCKVVFQKLSRLRPEDFNSAGTKESASDNPDGETPMTSGAAFPEPLMMDPSLDGNTVVAQNQSAHGADMVIPDSISSISSHSTTGGTTNEPRQSHESDGLPETIQPYSLPSIRELFRVLIDLLDPFNPQHTDTVRIMSLKMIDVALEVAGPAIASHKSLSDPATDNLCRHLFRLVRSENLAVLHISLHVLGTLLSTCRPALKLQQEVYLSYLVACLHSTVEIPREPGIDPELYNGVPQVPKSAKAFTQSPTSKNGQSTPIPIKDHRRLGMGGGLRSPAAREIMVENISVLTRIPTFMVELFVNYDSDVDRADLCEDMVGLFSRNAFPDSVTWSTTNVPPLCLNALLQHVEFMAERADMDPDPEAIALRDRLRQQRDRKKIVIEGALKFNQDPKDGINYLVSQNIIEEPNNPKCVATFLRGCSRLSKQVLGEYISKKSNEDLLDAFIDLFDFAGKDIVEALRELLGSFRLPGEAPLISKILTVFSEKYIQKAHPPAVADPDSLYVLTYAIIMLNTNLYNPNIRASDRMSLSAFSRNLSGVNGGGDFPEDSLELIYTSIKDNEIILPDERQTKHAFDITWKDLLYKSQQADDMIMCSSNAFDADMFKVTWRPVVATLSYVFMSASDDAVFSRVVAGFDLCAKLGAKYGLSEVLDRIIHCLSSISTLTSVLPPSTSLNTEVQVEGKKVMVSELAVRLGRDFRAQLATVTLFRIIHGRESVIDAGWKEITLILNRLFVNALIPQFECLPNHLDLPPIPQRNPSHGIDKSRNDSGILSAFTSYFAAYTADVPPEPSDEELENTLGTVECISACCIPEIYSNISRLPLPSVYNIVVRLLSRLPESSPAVNITRLDLKTDYNHREYDSGIIFSLDVATRLAFRDEASIVEIGGPLTAALQSIVIDAKNYHSLAISHAISYLFELLRRSNSHEFIRTPVVLHAIATLERDIVGPYSGPIVKGLCSCLDHGPPLQTDITGSSDFWSILERLHSNQRAFAIAAGLIQRLVASGLLPAQEHKEEVPAPAETEAKTVTDNETQAKVESQK